MSMFGFSLTSRLLSIRNFLLFFFVCTLCATTKTLHAQTSRQLVVEAQQLLTSTPSQPQQALTLLQAAEETHAGDTEFDYWLGVAATRSNEPALALLSLNRVLIQQPLHAGARLERATAYLQLNQDQEALSDLNYLQNLQPPAAAQQTIDRYRAVIAERERRKTAPTHLYMLSTDLGYDTNVGRTPDGYQLCLGQLFCSAPFTEDASAYSTLRGVYRYRHPLANQSHMEASLLGQYRGYENNAVQDYNLGVIQGRINWHHALSLDESLGLEALVSRLWLGDSMDPYSWQAGMGANWQRPVFTDSTYRLSGHWRTNQHDQVKQYNFQLFGLDNQLSHLITPQLQLRGNLLLELEKASNDRDGGDLHQVRLGAGVLYQLNNRHSLGLSLNHTEMRYQDAGFTIYNQLQAVEREDSRSEVSLDYNWMINPYWMLQLQAIHRTQDSNIDFYNARQNLLQAGISYIWQRIGQR